MLGHSAQCQDFSGGIANKTRVRSICGWSYVGFFDINTSVEDLLARIESEIDVTESVDKHRRKKVMAKWKKLMYESGMDESKLLPPLPSQLVTDIDLIEFYEAMKFYVMPKTAGTTKCWSKTEG